MSVKFMIGRGLDGQVLDQFESTYGAIKGGPLRLLQWLESQLGLVRADVSATTRALQYLDCLRLFDSADRFYHASLAIDPLGVARQILTWRDELYLAGWAGGDIPAATARLRDIVEVEVEAVGKVAFNEGQRVQSVIDGLSSHVPTVDIRTVDDLLAYPRVWQRLLAQLNTKYVPLHSESSATADSDLGALQRAILSPTGEKVSFTDDGSICFIKAPSRAISALWASRYLVNLCTKYSDYRVGVLCDGAADELDTALRLCGGPRLGVSSASIWRPVFQLLPLVMELLWEPLNPHKLLEFLTHPVGPLPGRLRRVLADVVAAEPGIGGERWSKAIEQALDEIRAKTEDPAEGKAKAEKLASDIAFWLDNPRFPERQGADIETIRVRALALVGWLNNRQVLLQDDDSQDNARLLLLRALGQVNEFLSALAYLESQGAKTIDAVTLRRLTKSVRGNGVARPDSSAEIAIGLSKCAYATSPESCIGDTDVMIWWGADHARLASISQWTAREQVVLTQSGVDIQSPDSKIDWQVSSWLRPILAAKDKLVVVVHEDSEGHHPVFDYLNTLVEELPEIQLLDVIQANFTPNLQDSPHVAPMEHRPLPRRARFWKLPADVDIPKREKEFFSSLDSFINGPYMWVLRYPAKIRAGALLEVSDSNLLKGSLAHGMYDAFFSVHPNIQSIDENAALDWGREELARSITQKGAVLLLPGRTSERERFITDACTALATLIRHLKLADVVDVVMERSIDGYYVGGRLGGYIDMIATKRDGTSAVVDIKWGGANYRRQVLAQDQYLQLAVYAQLVNQVDKQLPSLGYFVIVSQALLMLNSEFFPEAENVKPKSGESVLEFWVRFENSWKQRCQQLDDGVIEVNVSGTEPVAALALNEDALPIPETFESFNEFDALVGWEANS